MRAVAVPELEDYSPESLDRAVAELFAALSAETAALHRDSDWKVFRDRWLARKNGVRINTNDIWLKAAPSPAKPKVRRRRQRTEGPRGSGNRRRSQQDSCLFRRRAARRRAPRHHPSRHPAPHRRQASGVARDGRDRRRLQGDGLFRRRSVASRTPPTSSPPPTELSIITPATAAGTICAIASTTGISCGARVTRARRANSNARD